MESELRKGKKKKKKQIPAPTPGQSDDNLSSMLPAAAESHYEQRIADLKENNRVLSQALESSYKTISLQDKTILDLQKRVMSKIPELLRVKLEVIVKTLKQLLELCEGAASLISDNGIEHVPAAAAATTTPAETVPVNNLPIVNGNQVHQMVSIGTQKNGSKKHKKKNSKNSVNLSNSVSSLTVEPSTSWNSNNSNAPSPQQNVYSSSDLPSSSSAISSKEKIIVDSWFILSPSSDSSDSDVDYLETVQKKRKITNSRSTPTEHLTSSPNCSSSSSSSLNSILCQTAEDPPGAAVSSGSKTGCKKPGMKKKSESKSSSRLKSALSLGNKKPENSLVGAKEKTVKKTVRFSEDHIGTSSKKHCVHPLRIKMQKNKKKKKKKEQSSLRSLLKIEPQVEDLLESVPLSNLLGQPESLENPVPLSNSLEPSNSLENVPLSDLVKQPHSDPNYNDSDLKKTLKVSSLQISEILSGQQPKIVLQDFMKTPEKTIDPEVVRYKKKLTTKSVETLASHVKQEIEAVPSTSVGLPNHRSDGYFTDSENDTMSAGLPHVNGFGDGSD